MPNQHKHKLVRPRSELAKKLPNGSDSVNSAVSRYLCILEHSQFAFSPDEWNLLRDACRGWASEMEPPETLKDGLFLQVQDAIAYQNLFEKWGVDAETLLSKLENLGITEAIAVIHSVERFWAESRSELQNGELVD